MLPVIAVLAVEFELSVKGEPSFWVHFLFTAADAKWDMLTY